MGNYVLRLFFPSITGAAGECHLLASICHAATSALLALEGPALLTLGGANPELGQWEQQPSANSMKSLKNVIFNLHKT